MSAGAEPDMPGFETLGPLKGCGKIDILFVINDGGEVDGAPSKKIEAYDALSIRNGTTAFLTAMQEQASEYDLQVMAVKGDRLWEGTNGPSSCCVPDKPCDELGQYPCDPPFGLTNDCDYTLGAPAYAIRRASWPATATANWPGDRRYLTEEPRTTSPWTFECVLNVGQTGTQGQQYLAAMTRAVGPTLSMRGMAVTTGFLRPDAMLVIVILTVFADDAVTGHARRAGREPDRGQGRICRGHRRCRHPGRDYKDDDYCADLPIRTRKFVEGFRTTSSARTALRTLATSCKR
jgi:hypothetical protein